MTKIIKQIDILDKVSTTLKTEFKSTVYSDEVLEGFDKPCFLLSVYVLIFHRLRI